MILWKPSYLWKVSEIGGVSKTHNTWNLKFNSFLFEKNTNIDQKILYSLVDKLQFFNIQGIPYLKPLHPTTTLTPFQNQ